MSNRKSRGEAEGAAEIAEFLLNGQSFGINGSKIKEIVLYDEGKVTQPPINHPSVKGVYLYRNSTIPLISLNDYLDMNSGEDDHRRVVVVTEFNELTTAFIADQVNRIHRLSWAELKPMTSYLVAQTPQILGTISIEQREILVLDLEQIIGEIFPKSVLNYDESSFAEKPKVEGRGDAKVFFAEDSFIIRSQLMKVFTSVGYGEVTAFPNGKAALDAIKELAEDAAAQKGRLEDNLNLLISDIEMPQLDGLALCRTLKKELNLKFPIIMFSSLINDQIAKNCREAGADAWISKPQTAQLIELMDDLCLNKPED